MRPGRGRDRAHIALTPTGDIGVYIHFPYCRARCPYCNFKVDVVARIPHREYRDAVLHELEARCCEELSGRQLRSIYFGGGTPSLFEAEAIGAITSAIRARFARTGPAIEVTVEANPRDLTRARIDRLLGVGVNRLSIGVQSLDDEALRALGRDHSAKEAEAAVGTALAAGVRKVTVDLISGLPGASLADWRRRLEAARGLDEVDHVSVYELTIHRDTHFGRLAANGRLRPIADDLGADMAAETERFMLEAGRVRYEVSNFARPGHEAVHNALYWQGAEYLGLGVAAHSMQHVDGGVRRRENVRDTACYLANPLAPPNAVELLDAATHLRERLFLGLRTRAGVDLAELRRQLAVEPPEGVERALKHGLSSGWLQVRGERWQPTPIGFQFADSLAAELI